MIDQEMKDLLAQMNALPPLSKEEWHKRLWEQRTKCLKRLLELNAPECIIEMECLNVLRINGMYKACFKDTWSNVKLEVWYYVKCWFWWKVVLRKSEEEIEDLIQ
jgi:hypothetical protein